MEEKRMNMTCKRALIAAVTLTLTTGLALAQTNTSRTVDVTLVAVTTMPDGAQLQPGVYRMAVLNDSNAPQVALYRKGKLVCKCPVKIENTATKAETTQLFFDVPRNDVHILKSVAIEGSTQLLVFSKGGAPRATL
jgi:hypothetical protein